MKLKKDENGHVVVEDGNPVYIHEDGKEIPFDALAATKKIRDLGEEQKGKRFNVNAIQEQLDQYKNADGDYYDPQKVQQAFTTLENLDAQKLVDVEGVERLKAEMAKAYVEKNEKLLASFDKERSEYKKAIGSKEDVIFDLMVRQKFATSPTILEKTLLPADMAAEYFGKNFQVVVSSDGKPSVIGNINGEKIFSRENPGDPAGFEEALNVVIDSYPMKDRIMRATDGGSGSQGNFNKQTNKDRLADLSKINPTERLKMVHARDNRGK